MGAGHFRNSDRGQLVPDNLGPNIGQLEPQVL